MSFKVRKALTTMMSTSIEYFKLFSLLANSDPFWFGKVTLAWRLSPKVINIPVKEKIKPKLYI